MRIIIKIIFITTILISVGSGCKDTPTMSFGFIQGPEGGEITFEYPHGVKETTSVSPIFGWNRGSFLEGNYWRTIRMGTDKGSVTFRLNFPKDVRPEESVVEKEHALRTSRLLLRNSQMLEEVSAELFIVSSTEFDDQKNAEGTVKITLNIDKDNEVYDVAGEIDAEIINRQGETVKITGRFWKQDAG